MDSRNESSQAEDNAGQLVQILQAKGRGNPGPAVPG